MTHSPHVCLLFKFPPFYFSHSQDIHSLSPPPASPPLCPGLYCTHQRTTATDCDLPSLPQPYLCQSVLARTAGRRTPPIAQIPCTRHCRGKQVYRVPEDRDTGDLPSPVSGRTDLPGVPQRGTPFPSLPSVPPMLLFLTPPTLTIHSFGFRLELLPSGECFWTAPQCREPSPAQRFTSGPPAPPAPPANG